LDSLLYSNCDLDDEGDEGDIKREKIKPAFQIDNKSFFRDSNAESDDGSL